VGSWDSLYDVMQKDENLNVTKGNVLALNTKNSLIFAKKKLISTVDLENILVVETENAIFLAKKGQSQKVKEIIERLQRKSLK
jgi:mannose-1-phosphate guanylyltransferase/mannose-6-phosphate isomerase